MVDFIHQGYLNDLSLCDRLIQFHQMHPSKKPGSIGRKTNGVEQQLVIPDIKASTDVVLTGAESITKEYDAALKVVVEEYIEKFFFCNTHAPWTVEESINLQHYAPGEGYKVWHAERANGKGQNAARHLVFMTYLNDVIDEGGTEFYYQGIKVQPKKGLTLVWPADWTYTHRGIPSPTQDKYIITGWYSYTE
jgi:hypothetical protein